MRIALLIQYDGTNYFGWQSQPGGNTIQQEIEKAFLELTGEDIKLHAAGRTDAGVHALGQVAHFDTESSVPPGKLCYALNDKLPEDISILKSLEAHLDFHAQYMAEAKHYKYIILNSRMRQPIYLNRTMQVFAPLNAEDMQRGADYLLGEHDFKSFCSTKTDVKSTVRNITSIKVRQNGEIITIDAEGSGFLRNMVRIIAGTLINCGLGKYPPEKIKEILDAKDRKAAGPTADASGLYLIKVYYPQIYGI